MENKDIGGAAGSAAASDQEPTKKTLTIKLDASTPAIHLDPLITELALDDIKKLEIQGDPAEIEWAIILLGPSPFVDAQGVIASGGKKKTKVTVEAIGVTAPEGVPYAVVVWSGGQVYYTGLDETPPVDDDQMVPRTYRLLLQPKIVVRQSDPL